MILPLKTLPQEEQKARIKEVIGLLDEIKFDFSALFKDLFSYALPGDNTLKELFPLCFLEEALKISDLAQKNHRLRSVFTTYYVTIGLLALLKKQLSADQKKIIKTFIVLESNFSEDQKMICMSQL